MMDTQASETPMADHIARFWQHLETEHVRICVDLRREVESGIYWDGATFPDTVAKAIVDERKIAAREAVAAAMMRCGLATGHGDTLESLLSEMEWQVTRLQNRIAARPSKGKHMSEMNTIHDPFLNKDVQISNRLVDRLRGRYASGPHLPNGEPEFGWRQFQAPPIQHEAAAEIERLQFELKAARNEIEIADGEIERLLAVIGT